MTCSKLRDNLALYAGGDLADARSVREIEAHLAGCEACRAELAALRASLAALHAAAADETALAADDPQYWRDVESKLRERALGVDKLRLGRAGWRSLPSVLGQAAMVLFVAGAVMWFFMHNATPKVAPTAPAIAKANRPQTPVVVLVRTGDDYARNEVSPLPSGSDVVYSDFNHVVNPGDVQRLRDQVLPAAYTDDGF